MGHCDENSNIRFLTWWNRTYNMQNQDSCSSSSSFLWKTVAEIYKLKEEALNAPTKDTLISIPDELQCLFKSDNASNKCPMNSLEIQLRQHEKKKDKKRKLKHRKAGKGQESQSKQLDSGANAHPSSNSTKIAEGKKDQYNAADTSKKIASTAPRKKKRRRRRSRKRAAVLTPREKLIKARWDWDNYLDPPCGYAPLASTNYSNTYNSTPQASFAQQPPQPPQYYQNYNQIRKSSRIPQGWVIPPDNPSEEWKNLFRVWYKNFQNVQHASSSRESRRRRGQETITFILIFQITMATLEEKHKFLQPTSIKKQNTVDDLILLEDIDEEHVLEHLMSRYHSKAIYTYIGPVMIAVNPYKLLRQNRMSLYDMSLLPAFSGRKPHELAPHPFAIAESAYSHLMRNFTNETILITGESGSGKTESSKHILQYVANISNTLRSKAANIAKRRMSDDQLQAAEDTVNQVRSVLLGSTPILEAFGNAQTTRNYNSSRFGKYMVLQLNYSGQVVGGYVSNYLLERSRVYRQAANERNFHVFYQLLAGATDDEKSEWKLNSPSFDFLANGQTSIEGVDDSVAHQVVKQAMGTIGMSKEEIRHVYQLVAAVLWLGNLTFCENSDEKAEVKSDEALEMVCKLLGLSPEGVQKALCFRTLSAGSSKSETHKVPLNVSAAVKVRDSLAKTLYENLFSWIVQRVNQSIVLPAGTHCSTIGILDIYGFEIFENNSFEQLCINYVNEKLQQLFISNTIQVEQNEYKRERVWWEESVDYFDNQIVCDLIEHPKYPGIFPLLDEQCMIEVHDTDTLLGRFHRAYTSHPHYVKPMIQSPTFSVRHYAGTVEYDARAFIDSNIDKMFNDIVDSMQGSTEAMVKALFVDEREPNDRWKRPKTTSFQFRQQVAALLVQLQESNPHYIRCIKPNDTKTPMRIDEEVFRHQVRYLGLVENLRVRRAGYCYRETYSKFINRFRMLSKTTWPSLKEKMEPKEAVLALLSELSNESGVTFTENSKDDGCFALGRTKVFIRHPKALFALEDLRAVAMPGIVGIIENAYRRYRIRAKLCVYSAACTELFTAYREAKQYHDSRAARRPVVLEAKYDLEAEFSRVCNALQLKESSLYLKKRLILDEKSVPVIWMQSNVRGKIGKRRLQALRAAANVFAAQYRGLLVRRSMSAKRWKQCREATLGIRSELERFMGKKKRRRDSLDRPFTGDYLEASSNSLIKSILKSHHQNEIYFAAEMRKFNQRFHAQRRFLIISETKIFNLKANSKLTRVKVRRVMDLSKLSKVSLSTLPDNFIVLHFKEEYDYIFSLKEKTEAVQVLRERARKELCNFQLPIVFDDEIVFKAYKDRDVTHKVDYVEDIKSAFPEKFQKVDKNCGVVMVGTKK